MIPMRHTHTVEKRGGGKKNDYYFSMMKVASWESLHFYIMKPQCSHLSLINLLFILH